MLLTHSDLEFLALETGLSESKVIGLTETEKDLQLVLDSICESELKSLISLISFQLFCRLIVLKESKQLPYSLDERIFIGDAIPEFIKLQNIQPYFLFEKNATDLDYAKYLLILTSIFKDIFKRPRNLASINWYTNLAKAKFKKTKPEIALHYDKWTEVLNGLGRKVGLSGQIMNRIEPNKNPLKSDQKLLQ